MSTEVVGSRWAIDTRQRQTVLAAMLRASARSLSLSLSQFPSVSTFSLRTRTKHGSSVRENFFGGRVSDLLTTSYGLYPARPSSSFSICPSFLSSIPMLTRLEPARFRQAKLRWLGWLAFCLTLRQTLVFKFKNEVVGLMK